MSLTLTYMDDLARVRIVASGLVAEQVRVERSADGGPWVPVRGGVSMSVVDGEIQLDDYEWPDSVESTYRVIDLDDDSVLESGAITPSLGGKVWLKHVRYPLLNRPVTVRNWSARTRTSRDVVTSVAGRSLPVATSDVRTAPEFTLELITGDLLDPAHDGEAEAAAIDLTLAAGGVLLVHVPAGQPIPGGYVVVGATSVGRVVSVGSPPYLAELPCTVVAPPPPLIAASTMPYVAQTSALGTYGDMAATGLTYRQLTELVADPSDMEVL